MDEAPKRAVEESCEKGSILYFASWWELLRAARHHARMTRHRIHTGDLSTACLVGFRCTTCPGQKRWVTPISVLQWTARGMNDAEAEVLVPVLKYTMSNEGRTDLARVLSLTREVKVLDGMAPDPIFFKTKEAAFDAVRKWDESNPPPDGSLRFSRA
jgi:hypothetical protein